MLYSMNLSGNVHQASDAINTRFPELVDHVFQIEFNGGNHSVVVFRAPAALISAMKAAGRLI